MAHSCQSHLCRDRRDWPDAEGHERLETSVELDHLTTGFREHLHNSPQESSTASNHMTAIADLSLQGLARYGSFLLQRRGRSERDL